jgi:hypothetical protein
MPKRTEEEILFPEKKIGGIVVKPWSFGQLFDISGPLETILDKIEATPGLSEKLIDEDSGDFNLTYITLARMFTIAGPELLNVISTTLEVDEDKVRALSVKDGIAIVMLMFYQNKEMITGALKNAGSSPQSKTELKKALEEKAREQKKK